MAELAVYLPYVICLACALAIFFSTRTKCDKTIGKVPLIGKVCKTKLVTWVVGLSALLCGSSGLMIMRTLMGQ